MTGLAQGAERILVIKFSALGDFVQAFPSFVQIRRAHPDARITLLTTPPFADFARASGLFDTVETDGRPRGPLGHLRLFARLRRARYHRVYDLQTSERSSSYFYALLPFAPQWSGLARWGSHRQTRPDRNTLHNLDRMADQLLVAGAGPAYPPGEAPAPDLAWAAAAARGGARGVAERFGLTAPFALLAPGASAVKAEKFWPAERFARLAQALHGLGVQPAVVGGPDAGPLAQTIAARAPVVDLTGRTSLVDLAGLGAEAALSVGGDSGPTHLLAYAGSPGVMLMSRVSDPAHCGPRAAMQVLRVDDLNDLSVERVLQALAGPVAKALRRA